MILVAASQSWIHEFETAAVGPEMNHLKRFARSQQIHRESQRRKKKQITSLNGGVHLSYHEKDKGVSDD